MKTRKNSKRNNIVVIYNSIGDFKKDLERTESDIFKGEYLESMAEGAHAENFTTTANYQEATELMYNGDHQALERLTNCKMVEVNAKHTPRPRTIAGRVGFAPHVANYLNGCPNTMISRTKINSKKRVITVYYHMGCNGHIDAQDIAKTGANLLSAIKAIEAAGVRVNLYVGKITEEKKETAATFVRVKTDGQPLDELKMAYFLANPSFFRRHLFRWVETSPELTQKSWIYGYGCSVQDEATGRRILDEKRIKYDKFVTFYGMQYQTADMILKKLSM